MAVDTPKDQKPPSGEERRRSRRLVLTVPVNLEWPGANGEAMKTMATAHHVSLNGASLHLPTEKVSPPLNAEISLKSSLSGEVCQARVARIKRLASGKVESVGVELIAPTPKFWGLTFQLQQATMQLLDIENAIQTKSQDVDFRILRSLADAVEDLRAVASVVHQWQELKMVGKNAYSLLDPLSNARVRRATQLFRDLTADIDSSELNKYSEDYTELTQAVDRLHERMTRGPHAHRDTK